mgnify:CR=1 FL=1
MKSGKIRTLRGQLTVTSGGTAKQQLIVDDGLINRGYKVLEWYLWENGGSPTQFAGALSMAPVNAGSDMDASNSLQIGWIWQSNITQGGGIKETILDPNHVIVRDLYVTIMNAANDDYNFMVVLEEMTISDDQAIINILKEGSQSL